MAAYQNQRMDEAIIEVKGAIRKAQHQLSLELRSNPQEAPKIAGKVLRELDQVDKLLTEFRRDAERPIGTSPSASPSNTGLKPKNFQSIRTANRQTTESQYQAAKAKAAQEGASLTRERVQNAGGSKTTPRKKRNSPAQLRSENEQLQNQVKSLEARVSTLEATLREHQIPLPI